LQTYIPKPHTHTHTHTHRKTQPPTAHPVLPSHTADYFGVPGICLIGVKDTCVRVSRGASAVTEWSGYPGGLSRCGWTNTHTPTHTHTHTHTHAQTHIHTSHKPLPNNKTEQ